MAKTIYDPNDEEEMVVHQCTQCGKISRRAFGDWKLKLMPCRCGAKKSQIIKELGDRWTCYCNSCGLCNAEGYGKTRKKAIQSYNKKQDMLSCDCEKAMPWRWICTKGWVRAYEKFRLGMDKN